MRSHLMCLMLLLGIGGWACDPATTEQTSLPARPAAIGSAECAACGMVVREQPAPRAQVVHRDGERRFFCSIADLLGYLAAPSPHGAAEAIYVESMNPRADPERVSTGTRPWVDARGAAYVRGIERPRVMGDPVLVFGARSEAEAMARKHSARVLTWNELRRERPAHTHAGASHPHRGG